jgi:hypothetical protein
MDVEEKGKHIASTQEKMKKRRKKEGKMMYGTRL